MQFNSSQPIGIFDSGIGGLTVAKALIETLPNENIIYFGDTAHCPWGDKSQEVIQNYALQITHMLLEKNCKLILIACNSASAAAFDLLQAQFGEQVLILNVIDPVIDFLVKNYSNKNVGLIATKLTVNSKVYDTKIAECQAGITLHSQATPLLTMAIEEGFYQHDIIDNLLKIYLSDPELNNIDALVLACTHYPLVKDKIRAFYKNKVDIIDASMTVAAAAHALLERHNLLHVGSKILQHFYISDYTTSFADSARHFFGSDVVIEYYPLWK